MGTLRGAFIRGVFDISSNVQPGARAVVAVLVSPQPHPGISHEHTLRNGLGKNGGETAIDGPTFLSTIGWDWIPAIRDRDTGIWQNVFLSATGPVRLKDPLVTTDLPLPRTDSTDVAVQATVENSGDEPMKGVLQGSIENIAFEQQVELAPHTAQVVKLNPASTPALHMEHPRLWWPNGYGAQNLYKLHLQFKLGKSISDAKDVSFGVRKITYSVPGSPNLTISVNGVPIFIRGGDWGLDEALKRIPRERLEAQIRMHHLANLNMIRNWVGQSTSEDFYELCDKYGILLWDEFFQPNPLDGPDPTDMDTYVANVRDKILRFRNHPSIAVWCARNEGFPPPNIDAVLRKLMAELEPTRLYQPSSTDGGGVRSGGPYYWRVPREFYTVTDDFFKTETGSVSVPTLESIHGMMPAKDWESINDDWAEHDLAKGAQHGDTYPVVLASRYGKFANLADFVRKAQLANYEAFRAMYEGRNAQLFHPTTGVITWMSDPAQPSFVWQLYHYDLEPNSSLFAVMHAAEATHIQFNEAKGTLQVINNLPNLDRERSGPGLNLWSGWNVGFPLRGQGEAPASFATTLGTVEFPATLASTHFLKLELLDSEGKLLSSNFYWLAQSGYPDVMTDLDKMATVQLDMHARPSDTEGTRTLNGYAAQPDRPHRLDGPPATEAERLGQRVLPVYYSDNYISLIPNETRVVTIEADEKDFSGEDPLIMIDGWNVTVASTGQGVAIAPNTDAQPGHWPVTGLPFQQTNLS